MTTTRIVPGTARIKEIRRQDRYYIFQEPEVVFLHLIIVEDLESDCEQLTSMIEKDCKLNCQLADFSFYGSGEDFLANYRPGTCDALFLDIMMDGISGIDVAKKVRESEPRLPIIFTTTEPDFALEGFAVHATDYLVKPLAPAKVSWCLKELREYMDTPAFLTLSEIDGRGHSHPRNVHFDDILYGQYQRHTMEIHTKSDTFHTRLSFGKFTDLLPQSGRFCVCGRSLVVNFSYTQRIGADELMLKNGERLPISRGRSPKIREAFASWMFSRSRKGGWA